MVGPQFSPKSKTESVQLAEEMDMAEEKKSCWTCEYQQLAGNTFFGICTYFSTIGRPNKEIPRNVVDESCKFWIPKSGSANGKGSGSQ